MSNPPEGHSEHVDHPCREAHFTDLSPQWQAFVADLHKLLASHGLITFPWTGQLGLEMQGHGLVEIRILSGDGVNILDEGAIIRLGINQALARYFSETVDPGASA
jgi:hypothetical protein